MIGKKNKSSNYDWLVAWEHIDTLVTMEEVRKLTLNAIIRLKSSILHFSIKNIGYGWSGGKDALVIYDIIKKSGIKTKGLFCKYENEYDAFEKWVDYNKPANCEIVSMGMVTPEQLNSEPRWLFPNPRFPEFDAKYTSARWHIQNKWCKENKIDGFVTGRRIIDGNICGKERELYTTKSEGVLKLNIIADWTHEQVLAYIKYNDIPLPPFYRWKDGWVYGTHAWTERNCVDGNVYAILDEVLQCDPQTIKKNIGRVNIIDQYVKEKGIKL
jgi:3'-phosphoadenosine 5'-phosphosulfate sulfotransferase (PAPS reductase)/FAD synthetase